MSGPTPSGHKVLPRTLAVLTTLVLALTGAQPVAAAPTVIATIPVGAFPAGIGINKITNRVYVANARDNTISVIDANTSTVIGSPIPVGTRPGSVVVNETTNRVYVGNGLDDTVSVIDGSTNTVIGSPIPVGDYPGGMVVNPVTNRVYVSNVLSETVSVIDGSSNTVIQPPINVGFRPGAMAINLRTNRIYLLTYGYVFVIDTTSNTVIEYFLVNTSGRDIAINQTTNRLYIANGFVDDTVTVIDATTKTVIGDPIPVFTSGTNGSPDDIAVNEVTNRIYVAEFGSGNRVYVIDGATNTLTGSPIPVDSYPTGIVLNESTNRIYVTNYTGASVSVIEDIVVRVDSPGLYNPANRFFLVLNFNSSGPPTYAIRYNVSLNPVPLTGDWDGDGVDTIGVYQPANSGWALSNDNEIVALNFLYGTPGQGLIPMVADWDGDGTDTVGLYNPANGAWLLTNTYTAAPLVPQVSFLYGQGTPGLIPIPGDWDGDGDDTLGVFNPANGAFILSNGLNAAPFASFPYGDGSLKPVKGDFDGDGTDTVGHWNPANGKWLLINQNASIAPQIVYVYGADVPFLIPLMGKWTSAATGGTTGSGLSPEIAPTFAP